MTPDKIIVTDKMIDIFNDEHRFILFEGPAGTGKSFTSTLKLFFKIFDSPPEKTQYVIAALSLSAAEKLFVHDESSFTYIFSNVCSYNRSGTGGAHIKIQGKYGEKKVYLAGFDTKKAWRRILGQNLSGIYIDEISIADPDFIREAFVRAYRLNGFLYATTNGSTPDDIFYTDFFDKAIIDEKYIHEVPDATIQYMIKCEKKDPDFKYYYIGFKDNPRMTKKQIEELYNSFPEDSFYYNSKIIGTRGFMEGLIFAEYMSQDKNMISFKDVHPNTATSKYVFHKYTLGIDIGAENYSVFTLNGFTQGFKEHVVVDYVKINHAGTDEIWNAFNKWYQPYDYYINTRMHGAFIDYGGGGAIVKISIHDRLKKEYNIKITNTWKYSIRERCDAGIKLFHQGRFLFTEKTKDIYDAFTKAAYNENNKIKEGKEIRQFKSDIHKDFVDATEYGQSPFMLQMIAK
jgi:hypothetical protein